MRFDLCCSLRFDLCCQNVHTKQCKIDIVIISEDKKIIQTSMKHFLLVLHRNAMKHNLIKFSAARLHVSSDKFWNCLKTLNAIMLKNPCLLMKKWTFCSPKLKKNICKTFYLLKCKEFWKKFQKSSHLLRCTKCMSHVGYWYITMHFIFFNHPTSKRFVSWTVGNRLLKPLCGKMLD